MRFRRKSLVLFRSHFRPLGDLFSKKGGHLEAKTASEDEDEKKRGAKPKKAATKEETKRFLRGLASFSTVKTNTKTMFSFLASARFFSSSGRVLVGFWSPGGTKWHPKATKSGPEGAKRRLEGRKKRDIFFSDFWEGPREGKGGQGSARLIRPGYSGPLKE